MCTVTYLPLSSEGFILTSNRDERDSRPDAIEPEKYSVNNTLLMYPKDPLKGGTWITASENGKVLCLLNGAFVKHIPNENYSISRGQVILDYFLFNNAIQFVNEYAFTYIEPFTLIILEDDQLFELRWDGLKYTLSNLSVNEPHIWSSVTLYSDDTILARESWFKDWLQKYPFYSSKDIIGFHRFGGTGNTFNDLRMSRDDGYNTVSISSIKKMEADIIIFYEDLKNNKNITKELQLKERLLQK